MRREAWGAVEREGTGKRETPIGGFPVLSRLGPGIAGNFPGTFPTFPGSRVKAFRNSRTLNAEAKATIKASATASQNPRQTSTGPFESLTPASLQRSRRPAPGAAGKPASLVSVADNLSPVINRNLLINNGTCQAISRNPQAYPQTRSRVGCIALYLSRGESLTPSTAAAGIAFDCRPLGAAALPADPTLWGVAPPAVPVGGCLKFFLRKGRHAFDNIT